MKIHSKMKMIILSSIMGGALFLSCDKEKTTQTEVENTLDAVAMDAAIANMFVYHDSVSQDVHHAQHKLHHHDSIYHHHDSVYNHHHHHYHHGDTAHHHHGYQHTTKQHHKHDSLALEHHKLVH